nr:DUF3265 domain-containing protein [Vibrio cholerae]
MAICLKNIVVKRSLNKRFKRDFQRAAFLLCVDFGGFSVMRKLGSSVVSPLGGRYMHRSKKAPRKVL